ncbi:tRNA (adenosine(37)-N6)-threonylcarbamoyltransferase complex dimerization subunit type 1 TsaB [Treponema phagedenis]|uniref:Universal bacterial protein YeaZ n=1 Tax=Treponema phagedenis TaxID=162 RepID=A0A0B7GSZ8_TREPH|nr:tRNA (adenosine(37)-N6)-threonylcarbamoyltransferase complex dimerization subunit type 1 TsaB [Treponema phagedenis]NVP22959.1 tRNA (adenosine(37)-N6)-threonylcarbamoyltransferase complex dimerization subunit type 1 TsaB [Treponema phagedenis]QEJ95081.1 tRNA (adenosine(37)-N6)-threonylcarbamoyltransferase complex dimerization subunit type 1 TsaB [Treponema phagedenis]QEJ98246.1 tRNA (adenosine(37)-N6)-threonylcarbamoyltransferase complex dimerization subunit type 1 TsaB [Treponema phagedenis]
MNILVIDTISQTMTVAAESENGFASINLACGLHHAEHLLPLIEIVSEKAGFSVQEVSTLICPQGPGSFTGLRIGYAAAKALQLSTDAKFLTFPTLEALAYKFRLWQGQVLAIMDAKRNRFYGNIYKNGKPLFEDSDSSAAELLAKIKNSEPCIVTGYGVNLFMQQAKTIANTENIIPIETGKTELTESLLQMAKACNNQQAESDTAAPVYIRKSDAEGG